MVLTACLKIKQLVIWCVSVVAIEVIKQAAPNGYLRVMSERLEAHFEHRIFYFTINSKKDNELSIIMYNMSYTLVNTGEKWINHIGNKMTMSQGLINAVVQAAY